MIAGVHQRRTLYISQLNSWTAAGGGANMLHLNLPLHARRAACTLQLHLVITRPDALSDDLLKYVWSFAGA